MTPKGISQKVSNESVFIEETPGEGWYFLHWKWWRWGTFIFGRFKFQHIERLSKMNYLIDYTQTDSEISENEWTTDEDEIDPDTVDDLQETIYISSDSDLEDSTTEKEKR